MAVTAVIGLALVGLALTAGGVVIRSLGTTETIPADNSPRMSEVDGVLAGDEVASSVEVFEPIRILVHVVGEVNTPGVVDLEAGSRVHDAIEEAGGLTADAAPESLNLARVLGDGEQVVVPGLGDPVEPLEAGVAGGETGMISLSTVSTWLACSITVDCAPSR